MGIFVVKGEDTHILNGSLVSDLGNGDVGAITFPNDSMAHETGFNGNTVYTYSFQGKNAELSLIVLVGSQTEKNLNSFIEQAGRDFSSINLIAYRLTQILGDGVGGNPTVINNDRSNITVHFIWRDN